MLGHQQGKICISGLFCRVFIAVAIYGHDPIRILAYHFALGIHAEGPHQILVLGCAIYDLAFIEFISQMGKDPGRELHAHTNVHTIGFCSIHLLPLRPAEITQSFPS